MPLNRRSFLGLSTILLSSPLPVFSSENKQAKRILVYGDSNSFGWAWSPEKDIYRLPIDQIWPQVMAQKLGPNYEVEVNALGGRTVKRDQKDGNGTGKSLSGKLFNGMVSLPAVLSENLPLDIVIVMLGTNDAFSGAEKITKELPPLLQEKCRILGAEYINAQDFVKGIPGQIDRVHLSPEQHKVLGEAAAAKVKEIFAH